MRKHFLYLSYLLRHKWFVFRECRKLGIPLQGITHDLSKFMPSEWISYAWSFYGPWKYNERPDWLVKSFNRAWLKHQHRNPHHWQYWILVQDDGPAIKIEIPLNYCKEMLANWRGAGRAISGIDNTYGWYRARRTRMFKVLHPKTRFWIESELGRM